MSRRGEYTPLKSVNGGVKVGVMDFLMPILAAGTFVIVLVTAIVLGSRSAGAQDKLNTLGPTIVSVTLNASCSNDTKAEPRRARAYQIRLDNAFANYAKAVPCHPNNGDEAAYLSRFASFTKGMPHDSLGIVNATAYAMFLTAVNSGLPADFDAIPQASGAIVDFTNPQAGLAFVNEGGDARSFYQPPAPAFASAEQAGEIVEHYWMALLRDVNFADYGTDSVAHQAVVSLNALSDFRGVTPVTTGNLFRGTSAGCLVGPYLSQFFYKPCVFGANSIDQRLYPPTPGVDFMKNWTTYLAQQNAQPREGSITYGSTLRHMITGRDLAHWVHIDVLFQAYFQSMLCLLNMGAPLKSGIPYQTSALNQMGFGTFGGPFISQMATNSAITALKAVWYQKWLVHRRLRPEVFAARVDRHLNSFATYPIHADALTSDVLPIILSQFGSYLLPQSFPEGSPLHPSYGAGHATVAGASVTILKALFKEDHVIPSPVMPNPADGGETIIPLSPLATLTVGGELDKVAWNVALGRNIAGVHWRSDATASLKLGEEVAISILRDMKNLHNEPFGGWSFTNFEGELVTV